MRSCVVLVAVAACSSKSAVIDAPQHDAAKVQLDARASTCRLLGADAGMYDGPGCGCAIGDSACPHCRGVAGPCASCGAGVGCGEGVFVTASCDGPEDCAIGTVCCDGIGGPSCVTPDMCPTTTSFLCHVDADCSTGGVCCPDSEWGHRCKPSC